MNQVEYINNYLLDSIEVIKCLDKKQIAKASSLLRDIRTRKGRLFAIGIGGGAGHASHLVNDFRKIANLESYCITDNVSELLAQINDSGWENSFVNLLKGSNLGPKDGIIVLSVGGGDLEKNISPNIVKAVEYAKSVKAKVIGIVGYKGGYTRKVADVCVVVPLVNIDSVTPLTESFQALIWHLIVSSPDMKINQTKWESTK